MEITQEIAISLLGRLKVVAKTGNVDNVEISNVSYTDADGNPFAYELREGETEAQEYAIVNLRLSNEFLMNRANELFDAGDYLGAVNNAMSVRVAADKASNYSRGSRVNVSVGTYYSEEYEADILTVTGISEPIKAETSTNSFAERAKLLAEQRKAKAKAKAEENL